MRREQKRWMGSGDEKGKKAEKEAERGERWRREDKEREGSEEAWRGLYECVCVCCVRKENSLFLNHRHIYSIFPSLQTSSASLFVSSIFLLIFPYFSYTSFLFSSANVSMLRYFLSFSFLFLSGYVNWHSRCFVIFFNYLLFRSFWFLILLSLLLFSFLRFIFNCFISLVCSSICCFISFPPRTLSPFSPIVYFLSYCRHLLFRPAAETMLFSFLPLI